MSQEELLENMWLINCMIIKHETTTIIQSVKLDSVQQIFFKNL